MRVLVTGGAGFIGSHLTRRLLADGHRVSVVDNESTGRRGNVPVAAFYLRADVTRLAEIEPMFVEGVDAVCHLAGQVSIIRSFSDPVVDLRTNVEGTLNVLQLCLRHKVPRLLYASSMTVYGNCATVPTPEAELCQPDSYYGITKHAAERYVHATAERPDLGFKLCATSLRMFSVYGPGQAVDNPYQGVLGIFIGKVMGGEPITIFGDGEQTRDFVYVGDVIEGWVSTLASPAVCGDILNLGSGRSLSIKELARHTVAAFGHEPERYPIIHAHARPGEQRRVQADIARARSVLGWEPRTSFEAGLAETIRRARCAHADAPAASGLERGRR